MTSANEDIPASLIGMEYPESTSAITYTVKIKTLASGTVTINAQQAVMGIVVFELGI